MTTRAPSVLLARPPAGLGGGVAARAAAWSGRIPASSDTPAPAPGFSLSKRLFDVSVALALLPLLASCAAVLALANPLAGNPGPLLFVQKRMGHRGRPLRVVKFRSMTAAPRIRRRADDPLETARITPLGAVIRRARIDELPQILNVLRGEMSLIGPRPDYFPHALHYARTIPGYRERHAVLPGITGLAQVDVGYAQGIDQTRAKVAADLRYVRGRGYRLDARIALHTLAVILRGSGS